MQILRHGNEVIGHTVSTGVYYDVNSKERGSDVGGAASPPPPPSCSRRHETTTRCQSIAECRGVGFGEKSVTGRRENHDVCCVFVN